MELNATILNFSDQTGMSKVALGKGDPYPYANMKKAPASSIYVDTLNKCVYIRMGSTDEDWVLMGGTPTKVGVGAADKALFDWGMATSRLQENIVVGGDDVVRGTLKYVNDFVQYGGEDAKSGYFLRLYLLIPKGTTKIVGQKDSNPEKELRGLYSDGVLTLKIFDDTKKYKFTFTGSYGTLTRTLDLSQLKRKF